MLSGRTIAITRPREQCAGLEAAVRQHGGNPLIAPLMAIEPLGENAPLEAVAQALSDFRVVIFISPSSVEHSLPVLLRGRTWPDGVQAAAVGPGTARALAAYGVSCLLPEAPHYDSEGLLAQPLLARAAVVGTKVLLLRGVGGRDLLAETLRNRGAEVEAVSCYRRVSPENLLLPLKQAWRQSQLDGLVISSSESLRNLKAALTPEEGELVWHIPVFVPHPRIAEAAAAVGFKQVVLTPPAEQGMLAGLLAYNWPR